MSKVKIIKLANNTLLLELSTGPRYITNENFGYAEICKGDSFTEEQILALIKTPPLPNGLFKFYMSSPTKWAILNITNTSQQWSYGNGYVEDSSASAKEALIKGHLVGLFASEDDIKYLYPECFI